MDPLSRFDFTIPLAFTRQRVFLGARLQKQHVPAPIVLKVAFSHDIQTPRVVRFFLFLWGVHHHPAASNPEFSISLLF